ncbi:hypothetical protein [Pseudomonas aeruginosa]
MASPADFESIKSQQGRCQRFYTVWADFCHGYNGPAQRAFARHIQGLGKTLDELTVADLKAAAGFADAELNDLQQRGLI